MFFRLLWYLLLFLALPGNLPVLAQEVPVAKPENPHDEQIAAWIAQLDSDRFDVRERAQDQLIQAGQPALQAVANKAHTGSLESSTRAVNILITWSESEDWHLAIAALESIATMKHRPKESASAAQLLRDVRERAALEAIVSLGGAYRVTPVLLGVNQFTLPESYHILIGKDWRGGTEGLAHLLEIPHATYISFYAAPVQDGALNHLAGLPQLQRVDLFGTNISSTAIAQFQKKFPNVVVDVRSGAFLGIRGDGGNNARVMQVVPDGAAFQAGIKPKDVITLLDGKPVEDFTGLTQLIAQYEPGDKVIVTVVRHAVGESPQTLELPVTFQQWSLTSQQALSVGSGKENARRRQLPALKRLNMQRR